MTVAAHQVRAWFRATSPGKMADICADVGDETGITTAEMRGKSREKHITVARHYAMWRARDAGFSYPEIGRFFNRDHSTVMHAIRRLEEKVEAMKGGLS